MNFRPISILPILSNVFERHVHMLISEHLAHSYPLSQHQWGIQAKGSTLYSTTKCDWLRSLDIGGDDSTIF